MRSKEQIEETDWAKRFKAECPTSYKRAVELAPLEEFVVVEKRDDHSRKGDFLWAVISEIEPDFWLEACKTKKKSLDVCKQMGWKVRK